MKRTYQKTTLITLYVSFSGLITGIFINRTLGPEARGLLTSLTFWPPIIAVIATLGINEALSYYTGTYAKSKTVEKLTSAQFYFNLANSIVVMLLSIPFILWMNEQKTGEFTSLALLYITFIPIYLFSTSLQGIVMGKQKYNLFNLYRFLYSTIYLLGILYLYFVKSLEMHKYVYLLLLCQLLPTLIMLKEFKIIPIFKIKYKYFYLLLRRSFAFYGPFLLAYISTQLDLMFVVKLLDFNSIGLYQAAYTIAFNSSLIIAFTFQFLVFPLATKILESQQKALFIVENYFLSLIGLTLVALVISLTSSWLVPLLFGAKFNDSVEVLKLLAWGYIFIAAKTIASRSIKALTEDKISFFVEGIYCVIFVLGALSLYFLNDFNLNHLCYLIFISALISNLYFVFKIKMKYRLKWREIFNLNKALARVLKSLS